MYKQFIGTGVAVVTPFDENRNVDILALKKIIRYLINGKVEYLAALGTTGESATLNESEQNLILDTFFETVDNQIPVVIGVGGNHTQSVCRRVADVTKRYPAVGILSVSPYYNKPTQEGIYLHYKELSKNTSLPIILYNVPGRTASNMNAGTVLRLAYECANIIAVKEASGDLVQGMEIIAGRPEGFLVLSGDDLLALPQVSIGYDGVISVSANAFPGRFSDMIRFALSGNYPQARALHYGMLQAMQLHFVEGNPAGVKATMEALDLCDRTVRLPLAKASQELADALKKELTPV